MPEDKPDMKQIAREGGMAALRESFLKMLFGDEDFQKDDERGEDEENEEAKNEGMAEGYKPPAQPERDKNQKEGLDNSIDPHRNRFKDSQE